MHIKKRGLRAMLYRSVWVKKGAEGNTHGFAKQTFVSSLPVNCESIPVELIARLTAEEVAYVEKNLVIPAREAADASRVQVEHQRRDPMWRLEKATELVREAAELSADAVVPQGYIKSLADAVAMVKSFGNASLQLRLDVPPLDPLAEALKAIRAAAQAVHDGHYGAGPEEGVRKTKTYETWMEITRAVEGTSGPDGLLRALQSRGWVKARGR